MLSMEEVLFCYFVHFTSIMSSTNLKMDYMSIHSRYNCNRNRFLGIPIFIFRFPV